ncbi:unnamed protein product, partial [Bubo scandiacus]
RSLPVEQVSGRPSTWACFQAQRPAPAQAVPQLPCCNTPRPSAHPNCRRGKLGTGRRGGASGKQSSSQGRERPPAFGL